MFVTNWISTTKIQKISEITNFFRHYFLSRTEVALSSTSMSESCGGGGSAPSSGWGKKDDEDDWKFAHRCTQMAHSMASLNHAAEVFTDKSMTIWLSEKAR